MKKYNIFSYYFLCFPAALITNISNWIKMDILVFVFKLFIYSPMLVFQSSSTFFYCYRKMYHWSRRSMTSVVSWRSPGTQVHDLEAALGINKKNKTPAPTDLTSIPNGSVTSGLCLARGKTRGERQDHRDAARGDSQAAHGSDGRGNLRDAETALWCQASSSSRTIVIFVPRSDTLRNS